MNAALEKEVNEHMTTLESLCTGERTKAVLDFAKRRGLAEGTVTALDGSYHSAAMYAVQLDFNAEFLTEQKSDASESFLILSILMALEAVRKDAWSPYTKLTYDLNYEGIRLSREERIALFAQNGTWKDREKGNQMEGNIYAVTMYCSHLITWIGSLSGRFFIPRDEMPKKLEADFAACWKQEGARESIEAMLMTFGVAHVGKEYESKIVAMISWMRSSDFYFAPASTKYHLACYGGLAEHTCNVIARHVALQKPQTAAELGEIIIADVCHDFCKANFYRPCNRRKKVFVPELDGKRDLPRGVETEPDGRAYRWENGVEFEVYDRLPLPHGTRSMHMAGCLLEKALTPRIAEAIEAHMRDEEHNHMVDYQYMGNTLALYLHMADVLASKVDEASTPRN